MEKKINLEEILTKVFDPSVQDCTTHTDDLRLAIILNPSLDRIKQAMKDAVQQALELAAKNAKTVTWYDAADNEYSEIVDRDSIRNIINQIE